MRYELTAREQDFLMLFFYAGAALGCTCSEIEEKFTVFPICFQKVDDIVDRIEIRISAWTLVCDMCPDPEKSRCDACWAFPDGPVLDEYINFCERWFTPFNDQPCCWEFYRGSVGVKQEGDIQGFFFG